ncbi:hypothetical protein RCL1_002396 [Eukaryota sp. TZLM3-RCL]
MSTFYYQVAYDFHGTDESELTVTKGQIVTSSQPLAEDEWILVSTTDSDPCEGYVPGSFMVEATVPSTSPRLSSSFSRSATLSSPFINTNIEASTPYSTFQMRNTNPVSSPRFNSTSAISSSPHNYSKDKNSLFSLSTQFESFMHRFEKCHAQLSSQIRILDHLSTDHL